VRPISGLIAGETLGSNNTKKIYLEPIWKLPISGQYFVDSPPAGYEFVRGDDARSRFFLSASRYASSYRFLNAFDMLIPSVVAASALKKWRKPPPGAALTYAYGGHLVFRPEPWVVSMEYPGMLLGGHIRHLVRGRRFLAKTFASPYCKKILCEYEAAHQALLTAVDCAPFIDKIAVVLPPPPPLPRFEKPPQKGPVKLFTLGSGNIKGEFAARGIPEVIEMFLILRQKYPDLELVVRSDMPSASSQRCQGIPGLRIIDRVIPRAQLEREFAAADIFVLPSHGTYPFTLMEAMSWGLPVITRNSFANPEFVADGRTGFLVVASKHVPYYYRDTIHPNFGSAAFQKAIQTPDKDVVLDLVRKVSLLIDDAELRTGFGKAARQEVASGKLSRAVRNEKLKKILDEVTGGEAIDIGNRLSISRISNGV
jgi:glycosyltransferase involved in cell wall biosynthesis